VNDPAIFGSLEVGKVADVGVYPADPSTDILRFAARPTCSEAEGRFARGLGLFGPPPWAAA